MMHAASMMWRGWRIVRRLGHGGTGAVDLVEAGGITAVLKRWDVHVLLAERQRECRNLYLAATLDVAPAPIETAGDGIVMAYEPPPTAQPLHERVRALLGNVNRLHTRGFVHRDLKPENVIGTRLIDLGALVDLLRDREVPPIGTPGYAAPEAYQGVISPRLDAYGAGMVIAAWLGAPDPDPARFGLAALAPWQPPAPWQPLLTGLLEPDPNRRLSVGEAFWLLTGPWATLPSGVQIATDLVTVADWQRVLPGVPCQAMYGYATGMDTTAIRQYLAATGCRLPTLTELRMAAAGTELATAAKHPDEAIRHGPVSDYGVRHARRLLWQLTADGVLFGGTAYVDQDTIPVPATPNAMIGLRICRDQP